MLTHSRPVTIRFEDADPAGVIFYPRAIALAHAITEEMIQGSPLGWQAWFASPDHAAPLRHAEADFLSPMRPGETFTAHARVDRLGNSSIAFLVEFFDADARPAATIRTIHVLISKSTGKSIPIPAAIRSAFA